MTAEPERRCIVTGEVGPAEAMLRFVVGPDGQAVFDAAGKLPGRGLWLSARQDVLQTAAKKGAFSKAAKASVQVSADLAADVAKVLKARLLDRIGLARRAGQLVQGFDNVAQALKAGQGKAGPAGVLIEAADAAPDGRRKMANLAKDVPVVAVLDAAEIGRAIGRDNAVHSLLVPGKMAQAFLSDARKLAGVENRPLDGAGASEDEA